MHGTYISALMTIIFYCSFSVCSTMVREISHVNKIVIRCTRNCAFYVRIICLISVNARCCWCFLNSTSQCTILRMLAPRTRIVLVRSIAVVTGALLIIITLGIYNNFYALKSGVTIGFLVLTSLSFLMGYRLFGSAGVLLAIIFNPIVPLSLPRHI